MILNLNDADVELHGKLVDYFKVPGPSSESLSYFRDKAKLHTLMRKKGLSFYRPTTVITSLEKFEKDIKKIQFPVVVKPFIGAHSRSVLLLKSRVELPQAIEQLTSHFQREKAIVRSEKKKQKILIESFIQGRQLTPTCYVDANGKVEILAFNRITRSLDLGNNDMQIVYRTCPSQEKEFVQRKVKFVLQRLMRLTGLCSSFIDPEFIVKDKQVYLIEVNPRMGGFRYQTMKHAFGIDIEKMALQLAAGVTVNDDLGKVKSCTAAEVWEKQSGKIKSIQFPKSKFLVNTHKVYKSDEEYLAPPIGNKALASYYVKSENDDSLQIAKKIRKQIKIEFE